MAYSEPKVTDAKRFHRLFGERTPRIAYRSRDFADYALMILLCALAQRGGDVRHRDCAMCLHDCRVRREERLQPRRPVRLEEAPGSSIHDRLQAREPSGGISRRDSSAAS